MVIDMGTDEQFNPNSYSTLKELDLDKFTDSYETFNRIINSLQRKYIELEEDFSRQNKELASANNRLVELAQQNKTATEFLTSILSSINAGVIAVDQKGFITHFNRAASAYLGIPINDALGQEYRQVIPQGKPGDVNAYRSMQTKKEHELRDKKIELSDGNTIEVSIATSLLTDKKGKVVGAVEIFNDQTTIKRMEKEITRLNTLAAMGEMAATVAHQVRNPLAGIGGFASLLLNDTKEDSPNKKLIEKIINGVNSLNNTIETLLNYTKYEEMNMKIIDFREFIDTSLNQFKLEQPDQIEKISIKSEYLTDDKIKLRLDKMLFRQSFYNILTNASEAMNFDGKINVKLKLHPRQTAVAKFGDKVSLSINETLAELIILDNGQGIKKEIRDKIFAPFYTTKTSGNGLGLAVTWKIVKAHGGDIFVKNRTDSKGAAFHILLPAFIGSNKES